MSRPTRGHRLRFPVRGCHPLRPAFPDASGTKTHATGLVRVRSPLLAESRLMSFPPATEMFQFAGFASLAYGFSQGYRLRGGLPHSEIPGSTIARISPGLFAACHVLHRLSVPRHPPDALTSRLSATPNGKDHDPDDRHQGSGIRTTGAAKLSLLRRHYGIPQTQPLGQALGPRTVSRLGHTTRFFTIVINNAPRHPKTGTLRGQILLHAASLAGTASWRRGAWWRPGGGAWWR